MMDYVYIVTVVVESYSYFWVDAGVGWWANLDMVGWSRWAWLHLEACIIIYEQVDRRDLMPQDGNSYS